MLENFQGDSWGSIPPLRMPSLLPHDLCHGRSASRWPPAVIEFQLSYSRSSLNMQYAGSRQPPLSPFASNLSQHQGLFHELALSIRWPKHWSFSFSISPSNEYSGLISFRMDWFDLLADWFDLLPVQGNLKCLLQHHSSKAKILLLSEELLSNSHIRTWLLKTL